MPKVTDYFRWRQEDAHRNALNSHCYWNLRKSGLGMKEATAHLQGLSIGAKNELLFTRFGVNFNDLPTWQKRGIGLYWQVVEREGLNPVTGLIEAALRRSLTVDLELPMKLEYLEFLERLIAPAHHGDSV